MGMLALSFNLLFGYMGQMSFGQAAFYGLGGYAVAMLMTKAPVQFLAQHSGRSLLARCRWPDRGILLCSTEGNLLRRADAGLRATDLDHRFQMA